MMANGGNAREIVMTEQSNPEDRLLSLPERELVDQTRPPVIGGRSKEELHALAKRLRQARDRARRIGRQQTREIRGKADPKGATPARDNAGTEAKAQVEALGRVTAALRQLDAPTQAEVLRKAAAMKRSVTAPRHPSGGKTASSGMQPKVSGRPTVKADPREVGRVSAAVKVAQAKRDR
jgi:type VI protein secretion system component VasK